MITVNIFLNKLKLVELTHLDLCGAYHKEGMGDFSWLLNVSKLVSLTLHNIQGIQTKLLSLKLN